MILKVEFTVGTDIDRAYKEAQSLLNKLPEEIDLIEFDFNGISQLVSRRTVIDVAVRIYQSDLRKKCEKEVAEDNAKNDEKEIDCEINRTYNSEQIGLYSKLIYLEKQRLKDTQRVIEEYEQEIVRLRNTLLDTWR